MHLTLIQYDLMAWSYCSVQAKWCFGGHNLSVWIQNEDYPFIQKEEEFGLAVIKEIKIMTSTYPDNHGVWKNEATVMDYEDERFVQELSRQWIRMYYSLIQFGGRSEEWIWLGTAIVTNDIGWQNKHSSMIWKLMGQAYSGICYAPIINYRVSVLCLKKTLQMFLHFNSCRFWDTIVTFIN